MIDTVQDFIIETYVPDLLKRRTILPTNDKSDYVIESCQVLPVTTDGTFMMSVCRRVKVNLQPALVDNGEAKPLHLDLVIKLSPPEVPVEIYDEMVKKSYVNEILVYEKILPQLVDIGYYPRYYCGHANDKDCSLVLGDFGVDGWRMAPTVVNLSLDHILLAVKYLGRFHGNCYAMKETNYEEFQSISRQLKKTRYEVTTTGNPLMDMYYKLAPLRGVNIVRDSSEFDDVDENLLHDVEVMLRDPAALSKELVQPVEPLAVICHGDFLRNNIAFKYPLDDKDCERPVDVTMFDFQTMCYTSPMMDLATFMANSTGRDVRQPHFEEIFRAYHTELITALSEKRGNSDLPEHYSYENFLREYLRLMPFGFCISSIFISILHEPLETGWPEFATEEEVLGLVKRGGQTVDRELAAQIYEICQLKQRFRKSSGGEVVQENRVKEKKQNGVN